jgi:SPP1 gp7 family putative phage head morphogenesis protein
MLRLTEEEIEAYLLKVHLGIITPNKLPVNVYNAIVELLTAGVIEGFGGDVMDFKIGSRQEYAMRLYKQNTQIFSGAKVYNQVTLMTDALFDENSQVIPYSKYKPKFMDLYEKHNIHWLEAEYQTAILQSEGARQWLDIEEEKEFLPYLQYQTIGDDRVREAHRVRDGVTRPVDDAFWNTNYPPIGWRCRCDVLQLTKQEARVTPKNNLPSNKDIPEVFRNNPGKDRYIFSPKHPYFKVDERHEKLKNNNFNLPFKP